MADEADEVDVRDPADLDYPGYALDGTSGWVYFVRCPTNGLVKIGHTKYQPVRRFRDLFVGSPVPLEILATMPGQIPDEYAMHSRFFSSWSHGEWFHETDEMHAFIRDHADRWLGGPPKMPMVKLAAKPTVWKPEKPKTEKQIRAQVVRDFNSEARYCDEDMERGYWEREARELNDAKVAYSRAKFEADQWEIEEDRRR
jgi:hypothetical protein